MTDTEKNTTSKDYKIYGAIALLLGHVVFVILILTWSLEKSIFSSSGGNFILFFIELPGVLLTRLFGMAKDLESTFPFAVAFIINTIFYGLVGFGLGALFQKLNWIDEVRNLFLTEEEIMEKEETRK